MEEVNAHYIISLWWCPSGLRFTPDTVSILRGHISLNDLALERPEYNHAECHCHLSAIHLIQSSKFFTIDVYISVATDYLTI